MELQHLLSAEMMKNIVIVAVSPDPPEKMKEIIPKVKSKTDHEFVVTLLSDVHHQVIDSYGLLNEEAAARGRIVPHPTTYVIDKGGTVRWKFTEKDYRIRPTNEMILQELKKLR